MAEIVETIGIKPYAFRQLEASDTFKMVSLINKLGIKEVFKSILDSKTKAEVMDAIKASEGTDTSKDDLIKQIGFNVLADAVQIIFEKLPECEADIYVLLSSTSNLNADEVKSLPMVTFAEMLADFFKKEEFMDFIGVVSRFLR